MRWYRVLTSSMPELSFPREMRRRLPLQQLFSTMLLSPEHCWWQTVQTARSRCVFGSMFQAWPYIAGLSIESIASTWHEGCHIRQRLVWEKSIIKGRFDGLVWDRIALLMPSAKSLWGEDWRSGRNSDELQSQDWSSWRPASQSHFSPFFFPFLWV